MHQCEFCQMTYKPRLQVKNPRACMAKICQNRRQRANERAWRTRKGVMSDPVYHQIRRQQRRKMIEIIVEQFFECISAGHRLLNRRFHETEMKAALQIFFSRLGVRRVNKLCLLNICNRNSDLRGSFSAEIVQTS